MRVVHAAALTAAAMLLASIGSAQGIGSTAAREREKRNSAPAKPAKVYTDGDLGASVAAPPPSSDQPADTPAGTSTAAGGAAATPTGGEAAAPTGGEAAAPAEAATPASDAVPAEGATPDPAKAEEAAARAEAEQRAAAQTAWRKNLEQARKEEQSYTEVIDRVQTQLNDPSGSYYGPGRTQAITLLEENKQKLAEVQTRIAALEQEGRRNAYR